MLFLLGSAGTMMGHAELANDRDWNGPSARAPTVGGALDTATPAGARVGGDRGDVAVTGTNARIDDERAARAGSRAAWGTLVAFLLAIGAAAGAGYMGAIDLDDLNAGYRRGDGSTRGSTGT
jgi:hypothetical protein